MYKIIRWPVALFLGFALAGCGGGGGSTQSATASDGNTSIAVATAAPAPTETTVAQTPVAAPVVTPTSTPSVTRVFSSQSFWYQPIPANATLNSLSAVYAKNLVAQIVNRYNGTTALNTTSYAAPIYFVQTVGGAKTVTWQDGMPIYPVAQTVNVGFNDCQNKGWTDPKLIAQWQNVPIPAGATEANGTDSEMSIYDISTKTLWDFWVMRQNNGQWTACWGGRIQHTDQSDGIYPNPYGTTATGLPFIGGEISAQELKDGVINHVMGISLASPAKWPTFSWPANRTDGYNLDNQTHAIPEGTRMRLDPSVNVDALNLTPVGKIIAKAAQKYGFVVWDQAGSVSLRAVNPMTYTLAGQADPYPALFGGMANWQVLQNFPWDKMQFMPNNYGKPN
jgi:hypothetical protein